MINDTFVRWGWLLLSACLVGLLGYTITREQFSALIGLYLLLFWGYNLRVRPLLLHTDSFDVRPDRFLFGSALVLRLLLLGAIPALSEDYARYFWDGWLTISGINPFRYLPSELMVGATGPALPINGELYMQLNSPNYYTVYPPVSQAIFALTIWLLPQSLLGKIVLMRSLIILAEAGTIWLMTKLLTRFGKNPNLALLYALNPLVILELTGNIHFEGLMIGSVLLALWIWLHLTGTRQLVGAAGSLALGICTNLLPLLLLPLAVARSGWRRGLFYSGLVLGMVVLLFSPFLDPELLQHLLTSADLYFREVEFNASVYYLIQAAGIRFYGANWLGHTGSWLPVIITLGLLFIAFRREVRRGSFPLTTRVLWLLTLYFSMATTVHPWYLTSLVAAAVFAATGTGQPFRYPLLWSALVWVSYAAYQYTPIRESPTLLALEYVPVFALLFVEVKRTATRLPLL